MSANGQARPVNAGDAGAAAGARQWRGARRRALPWLVVGALLVAATAVAGSAALSSPPARQVLPATPRLWLDAYEAAAIVSPGRVCSDLFSPALARSYGRVVGGSCRRYFARITSFSVAVRRVLRDGGTAVLELRQSVRPRDWAVVLDRRPTGWQAVDLLAGDLVR